MIASCLVFAVLASQVVSVIEAIPPVEEIYSLPSNEYNTKGRTDKERKFGIEISNPDDENYIERPCNTYDLNCIRKYFADHSKCKIMYGLVPDPLYDPQATFQLPRINFTLTALKLNYFGLNGNIAEFYVNKKTDRLVLSVNFKNLQTNSADNFFQFHRVGKESLVTNAFFNVTYLSAGSTITIPNLKDLQLKDSQVFSYTNPPDTPILNVNPEAFADPRLVPSLLAFLADIPSNVIEGFLLQSPVFIASFIQYSICDFGLIVF